MSFKPFKIIPPKNEKVPILVSVPHCGNVFPDGLKEEFYPEMVEKQEDTDWFVDQLYDFVGEMGITMIKSVVHRWVIDLNRSPDNTPLYRDGRVITGLVPENDFNGNLLYISAPPDQREIEERKRTYYWPYYEKIERILITLKKEFGQVLFFDAHSIKRLVPGIRKEPFPDLILGDADERSAGQEFIQIVLQTLKSSIYECNHNIPFKGGHLARYFGKPEENVHALQLEMAKDIYMDDSELHYHRERADKIRKVLKAMFQALTQQLLTNGQKINSHI